MVGGGKREPQHRLLNAFPEVEAVFLLLVCQLKPDLGMS